MLYRKQYKWGSLITALMFALFIGYTYISNVWTAPLLQQLYVEVGADPNAVTISNQQALAVFDLLKQDPHDMLIFLAPIAIMGVMFVIMVLVGLRGNRMYMNHCLKTIHKIRTEQLPDAEYNVQLQTQGNVNIPLSICLLICYLIVTWIPRIFL